MSPCWFQVIDLHQFFVYVIMLLKSSKNMPNPYHNFCRWNGIILGCLNNNKQIYICRYVKWHWFLHSYYNVLYER